MTIERIHNLETGEIIERQMTETEIALREQMLIAETQAVAEATAAKTALLTKLGITEEEAKLLLS